jgi:hypothetical protein
MSQSSMHYAWGPYLRWMLATLILIIVVAGAFNVLVDPAGVFGSPRIAGVNIVKPHLDHHRELSRFQGALRQCAGAGIFGNSRAEIGFDPKSPALANHGFSAFNHAIPGTGASSTHRQLLWLQGAGCFPKTIFVGVEFFDFLGGSKPQPLPTLQGSPAPRANWSFLAESVFSISGLRDAATTLALQRARYPESSTEQGFNPLLNYIPEVEQSGHYVLFRKRAEENIRNWLRKDFRIRPHEGGMSGDEADLAAILGMASASGSKTYLIIYPYHAQIRMLMARLGMGQIFAEWKRLVVASAERYGRLNGDVEVWDFSVISPETLEAIPAKGDRQTHLAYYWEAGHFKKALGDRVMERVLGGTGDFGIKLDSRNLDAWLEEDQRRITALLATPSPLLREVEDLLATRK